jgi:hypothetical protein
VPRTNNSVETMLLQKILQIFIKDLIYRRIASLFVSDFTRTTTIQTQNKNNRKEQNIR